MQDAQACRDLSAETELGRAARPHTGLVAVAQHSLEGDHDSCRLEWAVTPVKALGVISSGRREDEGAFEDGRWQDRALPAQDGSSGSREASLGERLRLRLLLAVTQQGLARGLAEPHEERICTGCLLHFTQTRELILEFNEES